MVRPGIRARIRWSTCRLLHDAVLRTGYARGAHAVTLLACYRLGPPRYFVPICILYPFGFYCGPAGYEERVEVDESTEPIIVVAADTKEETE